ncbi:MAG: hypothetical protein OHK0017_12820 [Patescibacteria group bacterium]
MIKKLVVIAHKYLSGPSDDLVIYAKNKELDKVLYIFHSFADKPDRKSYFELYEKGMLKLKGDSLDFAGWPEPLIYLKELIYTFWWVYRFAWKWDRIVALDGLSCLFAIILRWFAKTREVIFWAIDFVIPDKRFSNSLKNKIYLAINRFSYSNSNQMWDLSPRMAEARQNYVDFPITGYKLRKIVPYGMWTQRIKTVSYEDCDQNSLVFMGHLLPKQGVELILELLPELLKINPLIKLKIIGGGALDYELKLKNLAHSLGILESVKFYGKIIDPIEMEQEIAKSAIALAPYIRKLDTWTYYADPGKVKTYLACGVPVLLTDLPWNAKDIEMAECGKIITEDANDIIEKIVFLLNPDQNRSYRKSAIKYSAQFDYQQIFDQNF